jgi:hypothetical protein
MSQLAKGKQPRTRTSSGWLGWLAIAALVVVAIAVFVWWLQNRQVFEIQGGDEQLLVLLRSDEQGAYQLRYEGRRPVDLQSLQVMLEGQVLHVDVVQVAVAPGDAAEGESGQEIVLQGDGTLPAGSEFRLDPGEEFQVLVTFRGQTLGGNYIYGFRIGYQNGNRLRTYELNLNHQYAVFVE